MFGLSLQLFISFLFTSVLFFSTSLSAAERDGVVNLGDWSQEKIETVIQQSTDASTVGQKVRLISAAFLGTPYRAGTMIGRVDIPETLVIRFDGVDCFTLLDYVEALRRSDSFTNFKSHLTTVRYKKSQIGYLTRNHFFTDWAQSNSDYIKNVTRQVGGVSTEYVDKTLNLNKNGDTFLDGYPTIQRRIDYIPADQIDSDILSRLKGGDYIGIYSPKAGLDVSHTGIIIKRESKTFLRHASSSKAINKVVDIELLPYLKGYKGIIILRPK
jgi:N-acetylmuramoyl-L-alanine amidase-like